MKFFSSLLCAILFAVVGSLSAKSQVYTICNTSPVAVNVCLIANCGGVTVTLAPCPVPLTPGMCFSWSVPAGCAITDLDINGSIYAVQPAGTVVPLNPPNPPNNVVFDPYGPDTAEIQ